MTPEEYASEVERTTPHMIPRDRLLMGALGLAGESGEVIDHIKKHVFQGHPIDDESHDALVKEMGDVFWYFTSLCNSLGMSLNQIMSVNSDKLRTRYPNGFDAKASINRSA